MLYCHKKVESINKLTEFFVQNTVIYSSQQGWFYLNIYVILYKVTLKYICLKVPSAHYASIEFLVV